MIRILRGVLRIFRRLRRHFIISIIASRHFHEIVTYSGWGVDLHFF